MKIRRDDCLIVGGKRAARGGAAFARAPLVVKCDGERYIVRRIGYSEMIEGELLSPEEWRGVLGSREALELSEGYRATPNAALWLMRSNFSFRDEAMDTLKKQKAILYSEKQEEAWVLLVDQSAASGLTDRWAERAYNQAWESARAERLSEALEAAELAMDLARGLRVDDVALLSLLYERQGDKERAEAYLEFARNSRGDAFYERAREKKERFARELWTVSASAPRRPRFPAKMYSLRQDALRESFGPLHAKDAA